jgi:hypothetical protein
MRCWRLTPGATRSSPTPACSEVRLVRGLLHGDPVVLRRVNGVLTIVWVVMIPVSIATGWVNSITYVSALSLWALVSGHWAAWQAARVEVRQEEIEEARSD